MTPDGQSPAGQGIGLVDPHTDWHNRRHDRR